MKTRRSLVAWTTILIVAWTALWPLVSAVHARMADEPVMLCHQAGTMVAPDEAPVKSGAPKGASVHCPLCIMAFYGTPEKPLEAPGLQFLSLAERREIHAFSTPGDFQLALPQSRAPPASIPV